MKARGEAKLKQRAHPWPILETERLQLRLPMAKEASRVLDFFIRNKAHLTPTAPARPRDFETPWYWEQQLNQARASYQAGESCRFFFFPRENPTTVIGNVSLTQIARGAFQACYMGYSMDEGHQGQGLMTEACAEAVRFAFEELRLHRIMANYLPTNERSGRLLRRLGFQVEGYARDYLYINGAWRDHILTSLTNSQFTHEDMP